MRKWIITGIAVALLVSGLWFAAATALRQGVDGWLATQQEAGWVATARDIGVAGYPIRLTTSLREPRLADPASGWAWQGEDLSLSWRLVEPGRVTLTAPAQHSFATPVEEVEIRNDSLDATVRVSVSPSPILRNARIAADGMALAGSSGWTAALREGLFDVTHAPETGAPHRYRLTASAIGALPSAALRNRLDPEGSLPERIEALRIDALIDFAAPLDLAAFEAGDMAATRIEVREGEALWGSMVFTLGGTITIGPDGTPDGALTINAVHWRDIVALVTQSGLMDPGMGQMIEGLLRPLAEAGGDADDLDTEIAIRDGIVYFGPLPLGPAPRFAPYRQ